MRSYSEYLGHEYLTHLSHLQAPDKKILSRELMQDVDKWLTKNKMTVLQGIKFKPRPARSTVESPKEKYTSNLQFLRIMNWCNAGNIKRPRRTALSELSGISLSRVRSSITTGRCARMLSSEYKIYLSLMPVIEEMEQKEGVKT